MYGKGIVKLCDVLYRYGRVTWPDVGFRFGTAEYAFVLFG